jgi:peroxiredoxin
MQNDRMSFRTDMDMIEQAYFTAAGDDGRMAIEEADRQIQALGLEISAIQAGDAAPDFLLDNALGGSVSLRGRLLEGPAVLSFFRGNWCPFCRAELNALARAAEAVAAKGASLLAISPQPASESLKLARSEALEFPLLVDEGVGVASQYGLVFALPVSMRPSAEADGMVAGNAGDDWRIPVPATYVIGQDGIVQYSFLDPNYRNRLDPAAIVDILDRL